MSRVAESLLDADSYKVTMGYFMGLIQSIQEAALSVKLLCFLPLLFATLWFSGAKGEVHWQYRSLFPKSGRSYLPRFTF